MKQAISAALSFILSAIFTHSGPVGNMSSWETIRPKEEKRYPHHDAPKTAAWIHISENYRHAQKVEKVFGVPAAISLAQSIAESGGGISPLGKLNNFFGHRSFPRDEAYYLPVCGNRNGWRTYDSPKTAYVEHGRFFHHTRQWDSTENKFVYPYCHLPGKDTREWTKGLVIYAGDMQYKKMLEEIIITYKLFRYNCNHDTIPNF